MPGFVHGTWTQDGHVMMVFADEQAARRYHGEMLAQGAGERPGLRCVVWDVAEVGAESTAPVSSWHRGGDGTRSVWILSWRAGGHGVRWCPAGGRCGRAPALAGQPVRPMTA
jgi:hypothetical protein